MRDLYDVPAKCHNCGWDGYQIELIDHESICPNCSSDDVSYDTGIMTLEDMLDGTWRDYEDF